MHGLQFIHLWLWVEEVADWFLLLVRLVKLVLNFVGLIKLFLCDHSFLKVLNKFGEFWLLAPRRVLASKACELINHFTEGIVDQRSVDWCVNEWRVALFHFGVQNRLCVWLGWQTRTKWEFACWKRRLRKFGFSVLAFQVWHGHLLDYLNFMGFVCFGFLGAEFGGRPRARCANVWIDWLYKGFGVSCCISASITFTPFDLWVCEAIIVFDLWIDCNFWGAGNIGGLHWADCLEVVCGDGFHKNENILSLEPLFYNLSRIRLTIKF